jgi:hypothetical protein
MKGEINAAVIFAYVGAGFFITMVLGEQLPIEYYVVGVMLGTILLVLE